MHMKAQVSSEFIVVYTALLLIFVVIFSILFGGGFNLFQIQNLVAAQRDAQSIATAINFVYLAGDGASYNFTPQNLMAGENITISDFGVSVERPYAYASAPVLDAQVNTTSLGGGNIVITNEKGGINISG
jgi:hypothetical protein